MTAPDLAAFLTARLDERADLVKSVDPDAIDFAANIGSEPINLILGANDPAWMLADIDAKRRIIELWEEAADHRRQSSDAYADEFDALTEVIQFLALPYADHEEFQEEWRV